MTPSTIPGGSAMFKTRKRKLTIVALGLTAITGAGAYAYNKFKNPE